MGNTSIDCARMCHLACFEPEPEPEPEPQSAGDDFYACLTDCVGFLGVVSNINSVVAHAACATLPPACPIFHAANLTAVVGSCALACEDLTDPEITSR